MIADQKFYDICFMFFYPTASATAYGWKPKFVRAKHSATAKGENCHSFFSCKCDQSWANDDTLIFEVDTGI
jgi:hypothetical protein